jgi:hypothetical protein
MVRNGKLTAGKHILEDFYASRGKGSRGLFPVKNVMSEGLHVSHKKHVQMSVKIDFNV